MPAPPITIREATADDVPAMIAVFRRAVRVLAAADYEAAALAAWAPEEIDVGAWTARHAGKTAFVAESAGTVAGFSDLAPFGHVDMLFVDPAFARRGVATALLARVEAKAAGRGLSRLTAEASLTARPVFERAGFVVVAAQVVTVRGQSLRNFRMEKGLA